MLEPPMLAPLDGEAEELVAAAPPQLKFKTVETKWIDVWNQFDWTR